MLKFFRRRVTPEARAFSRQGPPPMNPVEVGLALRSAREREHLELDEIRDRTDVPKVDLDALERGQLEVFHVEQAAVVGLWRYAEVLGMNPDPLIEVLHRFWMKPALSVDALAVSADLVAMPLAQLAMASSLLSPIARPRALGSGAQKFGLSKSTREILRSASLSTSQAVAAIGPGRPRESDAPKKAKSNGTKKAGTKKPGKLVPNPS